MYILDGNEQDVRNVIQENRIRVEQGMISITPLEDAELAPLDEFNDALGVIKVLTDKNNVLGQECADKDARISELEKEIEYWKNQTPAVPADSKDAPAADSKDAPLPDAKDAKAEDSKKTKKGR